MSNDILNRERFVFEITEFGLKITQAIGIFKLSRCVKETQRERERERATWCVSYNALCCRDYAGIKKKKKKKKKNTAITVLS